MTEKQMNRLENKYPELKGILHRMKTDKKKAILDLYNDVDKWQNRYKNMKQCISEIYTLIEYKKTVSSRRILDIIERTAEENQKIIDEYREENG